MQNAKCESESERGNLAGLHLHFELLDLLMRSLRAKSIAAFIIATLMPLGATIWITTSLLERSLGYATTEELDRLSRTLEGTIGSSTSASETRSSGRRSRPGRSRRRMPSRTLRPGPRRCVRSGRAARRSGSALPALVATVWTSCARRASGVDVYQPRARWYPHAGAVGGILPRTRELVGSTRVARPATRLHAHAAAAASRSSGSSRSAPIVFIAHRVSNPIRQLTAGLTGLPAANGIGGSSTRRDDEVGGPSTRSTEMAEQLRRNRERLVYLTQMSSWQSLARKTAHELKNSLTPIRLTVEEMLARQPPADRAFMDQAVQIVVSEIETLERRVRAFSEFVERAAGRRRRCWTQRAGRPSAWRC